MKCLAAITTLALAILAQAEPPDIEYIYPAGGQRGTTVPVRIGGYYFHGHANFEMLGAGVKFQPIVKRTKTVWFEGPLIYQPLSQQSEDYPKDHLNEITIANNAVPGQRLWRCWTSQGATKTLKFVIGNLPEVMENEIDGRPIPQVVTLPVTANGRIFPREDVDVWAFTAKAGETIVMDAAAKRFGSPLNIVLAVRDAQGNPIASEKTLRGGDPSGDRLGHDDRQRALPLATGTQPKLRVGGGLGNDQRCRAAHASSPNRSQTYGRAPDRRHG